MIYLFAGIGGISLDFEQVFKDDIKTFFVSEWDEKAVETYKANFDDGLDVAGDITKVDEKISLTTIYYLRDFLVKHFLLQGIRKGSKMQEACYFLMLLEL